MNSDDKILKALKILQTDISGVKHDIQYLKQGQGKLEESSNDLQKDMQYLKQGHGQIITVLKALDAGQKDVRDRMATEADIMDVGAKIDKITRNHERRIEELEKQVDLKNPFKN